REVDAAREGGQRVGIGAAGSRPQIGDARGAGGRAVGLPDLAPAAGLARHEQGEVGKRGRMVGGVEVYGRAAPRTEIAQRAGAGGGAVARPGLAAEELELDA